MIGAITIYGHVISHYPSDHPNAGEPVIDCAWVDKNDDHTESNGSFVELNNNGEPRRLYGRVPSCNTGMTKTQLQGIAAKLRVPIDEEDTRANMCTKIRIET